uniref:Solute carrier family 12 member 2 n=1 Tax=Panagrellus redivivus TaxID=6233 RepID=A0A7E4ZXP3_PANRE
MAWVAGQAGILFGTLIVLLGSLVTLITTLSMSAICTNGMVKGGGVYYLISRSLGPEFGGSIGILFSLANAFGAAMYIVGLAETVISRLNEWGFSLIDGGVNDVRILGLVVCALLVVIIFVGLGFEAKMQVVLLFVVLGSIIDFYVGSFFRPNGEKQAMGVTGFRSPTFLENLYPDYRNGYNFFSVFSIYFPAATGIMAGANISGDLKNPASAIPKGTIIAIVLTTIVYISFIWITGSTVVRDANGLDVPVLLNSTLLANFDSKDWSSEVFAAIFGAPQQYYAKPDCISDDSCKYGLMNYFQVVELISAWGILIFIGVVTSTLSSGLLSLVGGPKIFQAVCHDRLFPYIGSFGRGYGPNGEPRRAYLLVFAIACAVILIGDLNAIAPIISNFYLCTYALTNFACFDATFSKSPGFRPSFKYYNMWISLIGAILCICVMFITSVLNALITFAIFGILFLYLRYRKPDVNWGSSTQAHSYRNALSYLQKLEAIDEHIKNYRPQILVLTGNPAARPALVDFAAAITKGNSLLACGHVIPYAPSDSVYLMTQNLQAKIRKWFRRRHVKSFYLPIANISFRDGVQYLQQGAGLGRLKPNIVMLGFKENWKASGVDGLEEVNDYFGAIQDTFDRHLAVCILRNNASHGHDFSELLKSHDLKTIPSTETIKTNKEKLTEKPPRPTNFLFNAINVQPLVVKFTKNFKSANETPPSPEKDFESESEITSSEDLETNVKKPSTHYTPEQVDVLVSMNRYRFKVKRATIDVWWLHDDGGLSLLIPYLLTQRKSYLEGANLRVFTVTSHEKHVAQQVQNLSALLTKFRIDADVTVVPDAAKKPSETALEDFDKLITPFKQSTSTPDETDSVSDADGLITEMELAVNRDRTWRTLRTAEHLKKHSTNADLIVLTLPIPRKNAIGSCLYLAWLEVLTRNLPPTLLVRGNQTSVLTFYS